MPWAGTFDSRAGKDSERLAQGASGLKMLMLSPVVYCGLVTSRVTSL